MLSVLHELRGCQDVECITYQSNQVSLIYFPVLVDKVKMEDQILTKAGYLLEADVHSWMSKIHAIEVTDPNELSQKILSGNVAIFFQGKAYSFNVFGPEYRQVEKSELETIIVGSHEAFIEDVLTNISLIRKTIKTSKLKVLKMQLGEVSKKDTYIMYIEGITDKKYVKMLKKRIEAIEIDAVLDINILGQLLDDQPNAIFPQFYMTELPNSVSSKLMEGRVAILLEGSPLVITAPTNFFEFMQSPEDYNQRWIIGTALRFLRLIALFTTLTFTALYVAVITYHYEMIPEDLVMTIAESRQRVPFPPIIEALLMELMIEFLREAGARLPTKIGQTIGIVGGIVIGQAVVAAGLTSNILIIAVASSAIASFVLPSYTLSNSLRIIRFGLIMSAAIFGVFGMTLALGAATIHVTTITSLHSPYLTPVAPAYPRDWKDIFIRAPLRMLKNRPLSNQPQNKVRMK
ncbi:spore germination protein [Bacillus tamaricis]|uniref:Spore germination protein n=2 Tax=Evansella tamaricis TaxID=2069301 RepID=A0ABS6J9U5_9BACI|nr:spore germination protein [Evansella tamaricis]